MLDWLSESEAFPKPIHQIVGKVKRWAKLARRLHQVGLLLLLCTGAAQAAPNDLFSDGFDPVDFTLFRDGFQKQTETNPRIEFSSDQTLFFRQAAETRDVTAIVYDPSGVAVAGATITWTSSNPAISVQPTGPGTARITATSAWTGTAEVLATYQPFDVDAPIHAVMTVPAAGTVLIDSALVIAISGDRGAAHRAELQRVPQTLGLQTGQIIVSGDRAGLMARVVSVIVQPDRIVLDVEPAPINAAFSDLNLTSQGQPFVMRLDVDKHTTRITLRSQRHQRVLHEQVLPFGSANGLYCSGSVNAGGNISIDTLSFEQELSPTINLSITNSSIQYFEVRIDGYAGVRARLTASLTAQAGISGQCTLNYPDIALPALPVGIFSASPVLSPSIAFEVSAEATGSGSVSTPTIARRWVANAYARYQPGSGWSSNRNVEFQREDNPNVDVSLNGAVSLEVAIKGSLDAGLKLYLGRPPFALELARIYFLKIEGGPYWSFLIEDPADPKDFNYTGPKVESGVKARAGFQFQASFFRGTLQRYLPLNVTTNFYMSLFEDQETFFQTPLFEVTIECGVTCSALPAEGPRPLLIDITKSGGSTIVPRGTVELYAIDNVSGAMTRLTEKNFDGNVTQVPYQLPADMNEGSFEIVPRIRLDNLGFAFTQTLPLTSEIDSRAVIAIKPGCDGPVYAVAPYIDGGVVVGGDFLSCGGKPSGFIARWSAREGWQPMAKNAPSTVYAIGFNLDGYLVGGNFGLARISEDHDIVEIPGVTGTVRTIAECPPSYDRSVVGGSFAAGSDTNAVNLKDGEIDGWGSSIGGTVLAASCSDPLITAFGGSFTYQGPDYERRNYAVYSDGTFFEGPNISEPISAMADTFGIGPGPGEKIVYGGTTSGLLFSMNVFNGPITALTNVGGPINVIFGPWPPFLLGGAFPGGVRRQDGALLGGGVDGIVHDIGSPLEGLAIAGLFYRLGLETAPRGYVSNIALYTGGGWQGLAYPPLRQREEE